MIRLSVEADKNGLIALWQEAFGDCKEAIDMFLDSRYIPENTVVAEDNGKIVSMLFLLEGKLKINESNFSSYYLYAAATAKSHRGRGFMPELLSFSQNTALSRGVDFICLKPADKSLYNYYSRFGYKSVFAFKRIKFNVLKVEFDHTDSSDIIDWSYVRNNSITQSNAFIWDNSAIDFAVRQHLYYNGNILKNCNGYCLYYFENNVCNIKEFCFTDKLLPCVASQISAESSVADFIIDLPVDFRVNINGDIIQNGMALAVTESAKSVFNDVKNAYLNLTLD
ncbi:MAG: GNAT family N-acetyltransferase [Clostridia bacterium]|nr:GNAT family N-acetyltransferase [Clostridia bacterium]